MSYRFWCLVRIGQAKRRGHTAIALAPSWRVVVARQHRRQYQHRHHLSQRLLQTVCLRCRGFYFGFKFSPLELVSCSPSPVSLGHHNRCSIRCLRACSAKYELNVYGDLTPDTMKPDKTQHLRSVHRRRPGQLHQSARRITSSPHLLTPLSCSNHSSRA